MSMLIRTINNIYNSIGIVISDSIHITMNIQTHVMSTH